MTTTADALEVLTIVSLAHRRTAPRIDDREAALATATIWAELFSAHNLTLPDLLAGVKLRAQHEADAPEPAEIIEFARKVRRDRPKTAAEIDAYEALCESKSEDAQELSQSRAARATSELVYNPDVMARISGIAKQVPDAE
jgi:hypothetical protein